MYASGRGQRLRSLDNSIIMPVYLPTSSHISHSDDASFEDYSVLNGKHCGYVQQVFPKRERIMT